LLLIGVTLGTPTSGSAVLEASSRTNCR
jgi:hypothetical protein